MRCLLLVFLLVGLVGCRESTGGGSAATFRGEYPIQAVATVGMVADIVRHVGGEHVEVEQLLGAGVDPHLYKATRDDMATMMNADIVFYSGLMLEGKMTDTLIQIGERKPVFAVTERLDAATLLTPEGAAGHHDPHVWMDVEAWSQCVEVVADALSNFDPPHEAAYRQAAAAYRAELRELHEYGRRVIASIPTKSRVLITSHDAFNYFGRAYDLQVEGVQGLSTESEAGLQRINGLVDLIVERKVKAVFVESSVPRKSIEALVDGAASRGYAIEIGGELFSDAMGTAGTYEGTYIGMLDHNFTRVARALGGDAPVGGMQGRLSAAGFLRNPTAAPRVAPRFEQGRPAALSGFGKTGLHSWQPEKYDRDQGIQ